MRTGVRDEAAAAPAGFVVVVGNGPVGQTTALLLARWGVRVLVLDRAPARAPVGSKAICQQRDVLDLWAEVGVGAALAAEGVTWSTARTFHRDRELFAVSFADRGRSPFPPWVNVSQSRVEQLLDQQMARRSSIEVRWGTEVRDVELDDAGVTVIAAGRAGPLRVRADAAVICAGVRADGLRDALGVRFDGRSFDDRFLICDIRAELGEWARERRFYFDPAWNPGRQVLIHPCPDATYRIDWQVPPDFDLERERADGALDRRIRRIIGDVSYELVWASVYRFHSRLADRMRVGRVLLAGDAAHVMAPFGARGLNSGVQDAENAAWKLAFVLRGWAPLRLLASYDDERRAAAAENLEVTTATMRFLVPEDDAARRRRQAALDAAARDAAARTAVDSGRLAEPFWYADSPLTTPDPSRPSPRRPAAGSAPDPAPGVVVPDVPIRRQPHRLRPLLRRGLTALVGEHVDAGVVAAALADVTEGPTACWALTDLDVDGALVEALGARPDEVWLVRPDAHVAAILQTPPVPAVTAAAERALALALG